MQTNTVDKNMLCKNRDIFYWLSVPVKWRLYTLWPMNIVVTIFFGSNNLSEDWYLGGETHWVRIWLRDGGWYNGEMNI